MRRGKHDKKATARTASLRKEFSFGRGKKPTLLDPQGRRRNKRGTIVEEKPDFQKRYREKGPKLLPEKKIQEGKRRVEMDLAVRKKGRHPDSKGKEASLLVTRKSEKRGKGGGLGNEIPGNPKRGCLLAK